MSSLSRSDNINITPQYRLSVNSLSPAKVFKHSDCLNTLSKK